MLRGQSPARTAFLRQVLEKSPPEGLEPVQGIVQGGFPCAGKGGGFYLIYCGLYQPGELFLHLPEGQWIIDILDTWEMDVETLPGIYTGDVQVPLPGKPYMALRLRRS